MSILNPNEPRVVQRSEGFNYQLLKLDDKQNESINKIRTDEVKQTTQIRNQLREKRAKLETLQTSEKPDMKDINNLIDEIATLQAQQMKIQAASRQKIRSLLNDEQKAFYDAQNTGRSRQ